MKLAQHIQATYEEIDAIFLRQFDDALNADDQAAQASIAAKRVLTDNAFFVLIWGQLENEINDLVRVIVSAGKVHPEYRSRRLYYNLNPDRMKFEDRLSMVTNKQAGTGSTWATAMRYYHLRNDIAHGQSNKSGVSMASVMQDFYVIQSQLVS